MRATAFDVLAEATARTLEESTVDVTGALAHILRGSVDALGVQAAAVLVAGDQGLELLASTSHRVADLEAFQVHVDEGPCVDAVASSRETVATHPGSLTVTWPRAGAAILRAGYTSAHDALMQALTDRGVIERAKGALAEVRGLEMPDAYDALVGLARDEGVGLGTAARLVLERARDGELQAPDGGRVRSRWDQ